MRSYRQYCALARSLDVVGERWTLLIIRELFAADCRYSDLRDNLPGIASNLLAERLRQLQAHGVIEAFDAPRPVGTTVYRLTDRGRALGPVLQALVAWGAPLVVEGQGDDAFRTHWLALGLPALFAGVEVDDLAPLTVHVHAGDQPATVQIDDQGLTVNTGETPADDTVEMRGSPEAVFAALTGTTALETSRVDTVGPRDAIRRLAALAGRSRVASNPGAVRNNN